MNSLQIELDKINQQLELLTYRKTQLDSIIAEYSDVVNRVKSLVQSMEEANVEPFNLLMEIEGIIHGEPTPETDNNHEKINSHIIPFDPVLHGEPEPIPEPTLIEQLLQKADELEATPTPNDLGYNNAPRTQ